MITREKLRDLHHKALETMKEIMQNDSMTKERTPDTREQAFIFQFAFMIHLALAECGAPRPSWYLFLCSVESLAACGHHCYFTTLT